MRTVSPEATRRPSAVDVLIALAALAAGVAVRWAAEPLLATRYPFVTIFVVIAALSSWRGAVFGVPAMLLGLLVSLVLFINPDHSPYPRSAEDAVGVALYLLTGSLIIAVGEAKVRAQRRTAAAAREARDSAERLAVSNERLRETTAQLSAANAELADFAHIVAHDMAEPLRAIATVSTFLSDDDGDGIPQQAREQARRIAGLSRQAGELLKGILDYSTTERSALTRTDCDLTHVAADAAESVAIRIGGEPVCLGTLPRAECDPALARELFANLITNAYKYNSSIPKRVEIGARLERGQRTIFVRDNGIGIPADQAARIFQMFRRLHKRGEFGGGMGAGLAICRKIVDRHDGHIWVDSAPGVGTTFHFTLWPALAPAAAEVAGSLPPLPAVVVPRTRAERPRAR